ncbi:MAG: RidA family protein [Chloroflexi bacterium]|nr:RidA family protein [Chloroflexota bacterium]
MPRQHVPTPSLAAPTGPFVAVTEGVGRRLIFVSGQISVDASGQVVGVGDAGAQTRQVLENMQTALAAAGATLDDVTKVTVFVTNMADRAAIAKVREEYFTSPHPASTLVQVSALTRPEYLVEIEAFAVVD